MTIASPVMLSHSAMPGAPTTAAAAGGLIAVLDACLVNGFGVVNLTSLTVAANVATAVCATAHSAEIGTVISVAGASPSSLNGNWRVKSRTLNNVVFDTTGIPDQVATGTITLKNAPLGWTIEFTTTNIRCYRSPNATGTQMYLRVDDTGTNTAKCTGYETMSDVDTGTGLFPPLSFQFWPKRAGQWYLVGDDRCFYIGVNQTTALGFAVTFFGDFLSDKPADAYACALFGFSTDPMASSISTEADIGACSSILLGAGYVARGFTAIGGAQLIYKIPVPWYYAGTTYSGVGNTNFVYPDPVNNALRLSQHYLWQGNAIRGRLPGVYPLYQQVGIGVGHLDKIDGQGALAGHVLSTMRTGSYSGNSAGVGALAFDTTGPWR